tara:strand:- start:78 stop:614 length:537 start_codon:yes stop_codon:yes gene_type:complete
MITGLPADILEQVFTKSNNPSIFATNVHFNKISHQVVSNLLPIIDDIQDGDMAAYICGASTKVNTVLALHPSVRTHRGVARLMITRTGGFDYENFSEVLASDFEIVDAALQASDGYIFGLMPTALQNDPDIILNTAHAFGIETGYGTTIPELSETIQGIVLNAWEDFDDIRESYSELH